MSAQLVEYLREKRVALLGFGREGRSSYAYIRKYFPEKPLLVADRALVGVEDPRVTLLCGEGYLEALRRCDLVLKSPGISLKGVPLPRGVEISCQADLFLRFAPCLKAGVTGSKGKTTTSTLLYGMLRASGAAAQLLGNMGVPALDRLDGIEGQIAVIELSSHQLEYCRASPQVAVWTNLYEEHLDHYDGGFAGYAAAKAHICQYQAPEDTFIYNADQPLAEMADLSRCKARRVPVGARTDDPFLSSLRNGRLRGAHNRQNIHFAATAALLLGATQAGVRQAVEEFRGIPHRMCPVSEAGGIHWVDDSVCTIPRGTLLTLDALGDVDTLLLGGLDRGLDYREFARELGSRPLRNLVCMPETGHSIARLLKETGGAQNIILAQTMEEAVAAAAGCTARGKTCLLSPAAASYNAYRDFEEKGADFLRCIMRCINSSAKARPPCPG
jgi:UDP-N-acetylmuramoylalanine--D-glutamate ligase